VLCRFILVLPSIAQFQVVGVKRKENSPTVAASAPVEYYQPFLRCRATIKATKKRSKSD